VRLGNQGDNDSLIYEKRGKKARGGNRTSWGWDGREGRKSFRTDLGEFMENGKHRNGRGWGVGCVRGTGSFPGRDVRTGQNAKKNGWVVKGDVGVWL